MEDLVQIRFLKKVRKTKHCWLWVGAIKNPHGYGVCYSKGKWFYAHRFSWILSFGRIPTGKFVLHRCDNRLCVRPSHLFIGTQLENLADMRRKGRGATGAMLPQAKLSTNEVREIKTLLGLGIPTGSVGLVFNTPRQTITDIKYGRTWKNVST